MVDLHGSERSAAERAFVTVLAGAHLATGAQLSGLLARAARELGATDTQLLVVDHAQRMLVPLTAGDGERVSIDGTVPGRAFRTTSLQRLAGPDGVRLWLPILDGLERVGVIGLTVPDDDALLVDRARRLASLVAEVVVSKRATGDAVAVAQRRREMTLAAEMQWALMPPLTAGTDDVTIAAMLEPAYDVGGDLVDYAVDDEQVRFAVLDGMGHGMGASVLASVAVGAYRNRRRAGADLVEIAHAMDDAIAAQFDLRSFVTAVLADLDTATGRLSWVNAGHPDPLLLRGGRVIKPLTGPSARPLGVGLNDGFTVHEEQLEPADRVLAYTDGVTEARTPAGELFGAERLGEFVARAEAAGEQPAETMRRLSGALLDHQRGELRDDATQVLLEWRGDGPQRTTP